MANEEHLKILNQGVEEWNKWREENPDVVPDLQQAYLYGADLVGANLRGADLWRAKLCLANLKGANLTEAILELADLRDANLTEAKLSRANLKGANLTEAILSHANLAGADLRKVLMADSVGASVNLIGAILRGASFTGKGEGDAAHGFLELASAEGLETAEFDSPDFLFSYLEEAFTYAHQDSLPEKDQFPRFVDTVVQRIRALREMYTSGEAPDDLLITIENITKELIKYLKDHPQELRAIRPRQFEELIAEILASYGWEVQLTPPSKDGGYDIFAISKDISGLKSSWIIECKKYSEKNKVGVAIARALYSVKLDLRVSNALLASTSHFTRGVEKYAASRYDFELCDYEGILDWINTYKPHPNGRLYIKDNRLVVGDE
ncbi:MAG: pentapeptide repeat-containing protein [Candidatus Zixiibacteriota bacterium]